MSFGPGWKLVQKLKAEKAAAAKAKRAAIEMPSSAGEASADGRPDDPALPAGGAMDPLPAPSREQRQAEGHEGAHGPDAGGNRAEPGAPAEAGGKPAAHDLPVAELTDAIRALTALVAQQAAHAPPPIGDPPEGFGERLARVERSLVEFAEKMAELRGSERSLAGLARRVDQLEQSELANEPAPAPDLGTVLERLAKLERAGDAPGAVPAEQLRKLSLLVAEQGRQLAALNEKAQGILAAAEATRQAPAPVALRRIEDAEQTLARLSARLAQIESDAGVRRPAKVNSWPTRPQL